eukprot:CAMPEP_0170551686 /NCGR_PEP_ID=MMETSP0211-20121228/9689_1 /TAXON_ID=311385 /ORGANISM="Pseudokeronopsis sp., Strain OXSARD2" /LENGTH=37 /DNA_ID= /DNA_START= /DNA_END= /DNA_ORIENTATION=
MMVQMITVGKSLKAELMKVQIGANALACEKSKNILKG